MNRAIKILTIIILSGLLSCNTNMIDRDSIFIMQTNPHPFLKDHGRVLIVKNSNFINSKVNLYDSPGEECNSYLSENDSSFILVDCNGDWYSIDKYKGNIKKIGWFWNKDLPEDFVGVFKKNETSKYYILTNEIPTIYKFKDPKEK